MVTRLVKMTFQEEKLPDFLQIFESVRNQIAAFEGCLALRIYSDITDKSVIFTYSEWDTETALNNYRNSTLFTTTWTATKKLFKAPPEAWSMTEMDFKRKLKNFAGE